MGIVFTRLASVKITNLFIWRKKAEGGGALLDESHGIDLIRYFFGEVKEVFAIVDKTSKLEISAMIMLC